MKYQLPDISRPYASFALLLALLMVTACEYTQTEPIVAYSEEGIYLPKPAGEGIVAETQERWFIPDVPIPVGFVQNAGRSSSRFDSLEGFRVVHHEYQGRGPLAEVADLYERVLPLQDWTRVAEYRSEGDLISYKFTKGNEELVLGINKRLAVVNITIDIDRRR